MNVSDRFGLIDRIARELQSRFKSYELDGATLKRAAERLGTKAKASRKAG